MGTALETYQARHAGTLLALLGVALTACDSGSSDSSDSPPAPTADTPPLAATAISLDNVDSVGTMYWDGSETAQGGNGQPVDGLECADFSPVLYHVHTHLSVFLNGDQLAIPGDIGFVQPTATSECQYPVHTHDESGLVHVHATEPTEFTLGQFFMIWGRPLEPTNIADITGLPVAIYITDDDGIVEEYAGDFSAIQLVSHRLITIRLGTEIAEIPNYTWTGM